MLDQTFFNFFPIRPTKNKSEKSKYSISSKIHSFPLILIYYQSLSYKNQFLKYQIKQICSKKWKNYFQYYGYCLYFKAVYIFKNYSPPPHVPRGMGEMICEDLGKNHFRLKIFYLPHFSKNPWKNFLPSRDNMIFKVREWLFKKRYNPDIWFHSLASTRRRFSVRVTWLKADRRHWMPWPQKNFGFRGRG